MGKTSIIIAIDGFSSTGKSSFAKKVAAAYGLLYLDSGALYRAVTLFAMENGYMKDGVLDIVPMTPYLGDLNIHFENVNGRSETFIGGRNVEKEIRSMAVSANVSPVAADRTVRNYVNGILHCYGDKGGVIMDGRDIGTAVFPHADLKIFMVADSRIRAMRRAAELELKGEKCNVEDVLKNLQERDYIDSHREMDPLSKADDAVVLDNSHMTFDQQMEWLSAILEERFSLRPHEM